MLLNEWIPAGSCLAAVTEAFADKLSRSQDWRRAHSTSWELWEAQRDYLKDRLSGPTTSKAEPTFAGSRLGLIGEQKHLGEL